MLSLPTYAGDEELMTICRKKMGCDAIDWSVCEMFAGDEEEGSHSRRLLTVTDDKQISFKGFDLRKSRYGRKLMDSHSDGEWLSTMRIVDLPETVSKCSVCGSICENIEDLRSWRDSEMDKTTVEFMVGGCQYHEYDDHHENHCQPICSIIPEANCAKYSEYCACKYEEEGISLACDDKPEHFHFALSRRGR